MKTNTDLTTVNDLEKQILEDSSKFNVYKVGTIILKELVNEPVYMSQIC